jgi:putative ABC transport system permease protein
MTSRWKKVLADFWGNKGRTFLTIVMIAVGVFAVGFNSNLGLYMNESMDTDYLSASPSEAQIYAGPLDDDSVRIAREVPGVEAVDGRSSASGDVVREGEQPISIQFTMLEEPAAQTVNQLKPALGETSIPTLGEKQILVDASASSLGFQTGDVIQVELNNGKKRGLVFAGYLHDVTGFPYIFTEQINAYVTPDTLEWLGGSGEYYDVLLVSVAEKQTDQEHVTQVAQQVADRLERAGSTVYFVNVYQPGHHFAWSTTQGVHFILSVLGYMTVILSGVLIVNTITALMTQQTRQIGIMKAIGGGNAQVFAMYIVLILSFGLVALVIAVPLANIAGEIVGGGMAAWLNFHQIPYKSYPVTLIQQVIVALVVPLIAAILPIWNSVRITVREAVSDYGIGGNSNPNVKPVSNAITWIPRPLRLSLRNAFRRKARLALTLFTLVLAGAIFIGVYNLWASFDQVMRDIQGYFMADINMSFGRYYRYDEVAGMAESIPGVSSVEGWTEYGGTLIMDEEQQGTQVVLFAPPSTSTLIDPIITAGRWLTTGDENAIVIGNHLLNIFPDLQVGDWLTIEIDGKKTDWHIVGFYSITGNTNVPLLYVNYEYLSQIVGAPGQVYSLRILTDKHDALTQRTVSDQLQALYESRGIRVGLSQLGEDFIRSQKSQTDILVYFMLFMASLIAVVGGLGLAGTMGINVFERTREIGVMRAVGASNGDIQGIVIVEGMVIGMLSWLMSIILSIPITNVLCYGVGVAIMTSPMPAVYGLSGIIAWLVFTLVLATISSAIPARRASRLTVRDTLAYE